MERRVKLRDTAEYRSKRDRHRRQKLAELVKVEMEEGLYDRSTRLLTA